MEVHLPVSFNETSASAMDVPTMLHLLDRMLEESRNDPCMGPFTDALENVLSVLIDLRRAAREAMMEVDAESGVLDRTGCKGAVGNC